jgi:hypothetical protein
MRSHLAMAGAVVLAALAVVLPATAHAAAWPREATFTNAAGQSNGCTATLVSFRIGGPTISGAGTSRGLHSVGSVTCPTSANVHRLSFSYALDRIRPDGTVEVIYPMSRNFAQSYPLPVESQDDFGWFACTTPTFQGTHQWRLRMMVRSKQTLDNSDPSPFVARAQVKRRLTCPS